MSFGIKCLCAVAIKSPPNHRKTSTNVYRTPCFRISTSSTIRSVACAKRQVIAAYEQGVLPEPIGEFVPTFLTTQSATRFHAL